MEVPHGTQTVLEALRVNHKVETAYVCSSNDDINCIDDLCSDVVHRKYWTIEVNGKYETVNSRSLLKPQDKLVLKYASLREK